MATITATRPPGATTPPAPHQRARWRTTVTGFIQRHSVLVYYVLTFAISWGAVLLVIGGPGGIPGSPEQIERRFYLAVVALVAGPPVASLVLTGLLDGRAGYRELLARSLRWRVGVRWYAIALLTAPVVFTVVPLALSLTSPVYLPRIFATGDKASMLLLGVAIGLVGGFVEELGWTGFAIPQLRLRHGVVATRLFVGMMWGAWHLLTNDFWPSSATAGGLPLTIFVSVRGVDLLLGALLAYRVLMVWVYDHTESMLLAVLMHASLIVCDIFILAPVATTGAPFLTWLVASSAALWVVVAALAVATGGHLSRHRSEPAWIETAQHREGD
jgi:membrane protease YdiL (CAAX protease family)